MVNLNVLKVRQPIGDFYIGAINSDDLLRISTVDVRTFEEGNPAKIDGIQREKSPKRLKELAEYVNLDYATFPTSIIIAVNEKSVELQAITGCADLYKLAIKAFEGDEDTDPIPLDASAFVIDGQHRLAGLEKLHKENKPFELNVSIFIGADIADQAEIFSRVNLAQTKVNKSLMYDLLDYSKETSPYKVAHDVVVALNLDKEGPFHKKIKRLGVRTPGVDGETLAQATVVEGILRHLPKKQEKERNKSIFGWARMPEPDDDWKKTIFVDFYRAENTLAILQVITNFFEAVKLRWPKAWLSQESGVILNKTNGYMALIRFLKDCYIDVVATEPRVVKIEEFYEYFKRVDLDDDDFNTEQFLPGSSGSGLLYKILLKSISKK